MFLADAHGIPENGPAVRDGDLIRRSKADLCDRPPPDGISGKTGLGVDELTDAVARELETRSELAVTAAHARHRTAMEISIRHLRAAIAHLEDRQTPELAAEEIRRALRALESLIGQTDIEHVLDKIFSGFCIGK